MKIIRISPSKLESLRRYLDDTNDEITEESVIESIDGSKVWSDEMNFGGAYHEIIEHGAAKFYNPKLGFYFIEKGDKTGIIKLNKHEVAEAEKYRAKYPHLVHEVPLRITIKIGEHLVILSMKIDGFNGLHIHEQKTTMYYRGFDYYNDSCQWKIYTIATGAILCQYNIFAYSQPKGQSIQVKPFSFQLYPYKDMRGEIIDLINRFISFCKHRDLIKYLQPNKYDLEFLNNKK